MFPYFMVLIIITLIALISKKKRGRLIFSDYIIISILIIFSSIRYMVGTDYTLYYNLYSRIIDIGPLKAIEYNNVEIGYAIFNYLTYLIFRSRFAIFFTVSIVIVVCFIKFIRNNSNNFLISLSFFYCFSFYTNSMNVQRQYLATSILLLAVCFYCKRKYFIAIISSVLAILFHRTAIIFIIVFLIVKKIDFNRKIYKILWCIGLISTLFYEKIVNLLSVIIPKYQLYENKSFDPGIGTYLTSFIFIISAHYVVKLIRENKLQTSHILFGKLFIYGLPFYLLSIKSFLIMRIAMQYFGVYLIILLPEFFITFKTNQRILIEYIYIMTLLVWFVIYLYSQNGVLPYQIIDFSLYK